MREKIEIVSNGEKKICVTHSYTGFDFGLENTCFNLPGIINFLLFIIIMFIFQNMFENR